MYLVSRQITEENIFAYLICFRPSSPTYKSSDQYKNIIKFNFSSGHSIETIAKMMTQIYELEQLEYSLYKARGYPIKLEPFLLTLFHSQVKNGPCVFGMLLAKWYSRMHFAELGPIPE